MVSFKHIDDYILSQIDQGMIPGAVLLVAQANKILHEKAYGYAQKYHFIDQRDLSYLDAIKVGKNLLPHAQLMTVEHLFDLASLTKILATTLGMMLLIDLQKIQLDDTIKTYLPFFNTPDKANITIRQLLSHTSGLPAWKPLYYHSHQSQEALRYINQVGLEHKSGSKRLYSDLGFIVLGALIETITQQSLYDFLYHTIYQPLELNHLLFNPSARLLKIAATSHGNPYEFKMVADPAFGHRCTEIISDFTAWRRYTLNGEVNDGNAFHVFNGMAGHAGLFATARDINQLLQLFLQQGIYQGHPLIKAETVKLFLTKNKYQRCLGWMSNVDFNLKPLSTSLFFEDAVGHTGFTGTLAMIVPSKSLSLILLTNVQNQGVNADGHYNNLKILREFVLQEISKLIQ